MKYKNIILAIIVMFIFATALCGCEDKHNYQESTGDSQGSEEVSDAIDKDSINNKSQKAVTDSLVFELQNKVSDVQGHYNKIEEHLNDLDATDLDLKAAQEEGDSLFATSNMILIILFIIAIILSIIALLKINSNEKTIDNLKNTIKKINEDMGQRQTKCNNVQPHRPKSQTSDYEVKRLFDRITDLEIKLNRMNKPQTYTTLPPVTQSEVYFGNPINAKEGKCYFEIVNNSEKARFSAKIERDEASFTPLANLSALKGSDILDRAIEFTGNTTLNSASQMTVMSPGKATKNGNEWHVVKKAVVYLIK